MKLSTGTSFEFLATQIKTCFLKPLFRAMLHTVLYPWPVIWSCSVGIIHLGRVIRNAVLSKSNNLQSGMFVRTRGRQLVNQTPWSSRMKSTLPWYRSMTNAISTTSHLVSSFLRYLIFLSIELCRQNYSYTYIMWNTCRHTILVNNKL